MAFRLVLPKIKSKHTSDYAYFLPFVVFGLLVNFEFIGFFVNENFALLREPEISKLISGASAPWFRPLIWVIGFLSFIWNFIISFPSSICSLTPIKFENYNLYTFMLEIQARTFVSCTLAASLIKTLSFLDDYYESFPYFDSELRSTKLYGLKKFIGEKILRYNLNIEIAKAKRYPNQGTVFSGFINNVKLQLQNEWINSVEYNKKMEILMVDVKTADDHLYSGVFTNIVGGKENDFEAISMFNVMCYYPEVKNEMKEPVKIDSTGMKIEDHQKKTEHQVSLRKWRLIKNSGEIYILNSNILTVNTWYIRKGAKLKEIAYAGKNNYLEKIKWNLQLVGISPIIIEELEIEFYFETDLQKINFIKQVEDFVKTNNIQTNNRVRVKFKRLSSN